MSIFNDLSSGSKDNNYPYYKYINTPESLGASSKGTLDALQSDVIAMTYYVQGVLVEGKSKAGHATPLGNKYFMSTGATCTAPDGTSQPRYVYINNVPDGAIPLISSAMGVNLTEFEGLVPGVLEDLTYINPLKLFTAFSEGTDCQQITMEVKDISNNVTEESHYVLNDDIKDYNSCWFDNKKNPVTKVKCIEAMSVDKKDPGLQLYTLCVGLLGIYIMFCLLKK